MILGLPIATFTAIHVAISLFAIFTGIVVVLAMLNSRHNPGWTAAFLLMTVLTSVTGFLFPITVITPAIVVGIISCVLLALALIALYGRHLSGAARWIYVVTAVIALWFNVFVLIAQSFQKLPALHALAPSGNEPPFLVAQLATLVVFIALGFLAVRNFRPASAAA